MRLLLAAAAALCAISSNGSSASDAFAPAAVSFAYKVRHDATPEADAVVALAAAADVPQVPQALEEVPPAPPSPPRQYSRRELCSAAATFAEANNLPVPFFANLIWQESGFKPHVVSPVGAQGIAQFMPRVAQAYGLENPFDPIHALATSAKFLNELLTQFGNVGLAAAAYNAGPKRVSDFMTRKRGLPTETRNYVRNITGAPAEQWAGIKTKAADVRSPRHAPCVEVKEALIAEAKAKDEAKAFAKAGKAQTKIAKGKPAAGSFQLASAESTPVKLPAKTEKTTEKTAVLADTDDKKSSVAKADIAKTAAKAFGKIKLASADGAISLAQLKAAAKAAPGGKIKIAGKVVAKPALKLVAPEKTKPAVKVAAKAAPAKKPATAKKVKVAAVR